LLEPGPANQIQARDVQPAKAVIVNTRKPNALIDIGFAPYINTYENNTSELWKR
jgi:hypothetical protein